MTNGVYEGQYLNGEFNGQGTFTWPDGVRYIGEFKNGQFNGQGIYSTQTLKAEDLSIMHEFKGSKYVGEFKDGKKHGQGTWTHGSNKYVGEYKNGLRHGQGAEVYPDGKVVKGIWKDGELVEAQ